MNVIKRFLSSLRKKKAVRTQFGLFTECSRAVTALANKWAQRARDPEMTPKHILSGLIELRDHTCQPVVLDLLPKAEIIQERLYGGMGVTSIPDGTPQSRATHASKDAIRFALEEAATLGHDRVTTGHLLLGLLRCEDQAVMKVLSECCPETARVREQLSAILRERGSCAEKLGRRRG